MTSCVDVSVGALGLGKALVQVRLVHIALLDIVTVNAANGSSFLRVSHCFSGSVLYTTVIREKLPFHHIDPVCPMSSILRHESEVFP